MTTFDEKVRTVAEVFGNIPGADPEETNYIKFLYARRNLATVPEHDFLPGHSYRELAYIVEIQNLEETISDALDIIRKRDGEKTYKEAARFLRDALRITPQHRPARRRKAQAARRA